jgi:hypothetical protein
LLNVPNDCSVLMVMLLSAITELRQPHTIATVPLQAVIAISLLVRFQDLKFDYSETCYPLPTSDETKTANDSRQLKYGIGCACRLIDR